MIVILSRTNLFVCYMSHMTPSSYLEQPGHKGAVEPALSITIQPVGSFLRLPFLLIPIDGILASPQVCLFWLDAFALLDDLVSEYHNQIQRNAEISSDEVFVIESSNKNVEALGTKERVSYGIEETTKNQGERGGK